MLAAVLGRMDDDRGSPVLAECEPEHLEVVVVAYERGYFSTPRETTLGEIGAELGISSREARVRLRNGLTGVLGELIDAGRRNGPSRLPRKEARRGVEGRGGFGASKDGDPELAAFREAVEHAGHSIYITDPDGTILYVNRTFEEITGYATEEAIGQNPRILQSGLHSNRYYERLWATILAGEVWRHELVNERKDGTRYHVDQTIAPVLDADGRIRWFVAVNQIPD